MYGHRGEKRTVGEACVGHSGFTRVKMGEVFETWNDGMIGLYSLLAPWGTSVSDLAVRTATRRNTRARCRPRARHANSVGLTQGT